MLRRIGYRSAESVAQGEGMSEAQRIVVVGAGVVGICCASYLRRDGHDVVVLDPDPPGANTSFGNAGAISAQSCIPFAGPGMLKQVPGYLMDPLGPLAIRLAYLPRLAPWLARMLAAGTPARIREQARALRALHTPVFEAHAELAGEAGAEDLLRRDGGLYVYETDAAFQGDAGNRALMRENGVEVQELSADEIRQMEPALAPIFRHGVFFPQGAHCLDPGTLVQRYADAFRRNGGRIEQRRVLGFDVGPDGIRGVRADGGDVPADIVVIAAGAWSHRLSAQLGDRFPLETERGYHMVLAGPGIETRRPITFVERRFMATTMNMGLRLAGTVEFGGLDAPPNWKRSQMLVKHAKRAFGGLAAVDGSRWMGHRPSTPDSLPVIGRSPKTKGAIYAFGHGHLGLTGSAVTGRYVADLAGGRQPAIDLTPFRVDRY